MKEQQSFLKHWKISGLHYLGFWLMASLMRQQRALVARRANLVYPELIKHKPAGEWDCLALL